MPSVKRIAVTGGAGQIAYSILFKIAAGELFGLNQAIELSILELPDVLPVLEGVVMELQDSAFPLLKKITIGSNPYEIFKNAEYAFLIGSKPRGPGIERSQLLQENGKIFVEQGRALNEVADRNVKVLVVGNPCNTNCLIAMKEAPRIPKKNFHAMMRLDQNRAAAQIALKSGVEVSSITNVTIWGNHSSTQVPDFFHAKIAGRPVTDVIQDSGWLENEFMSLVQKRGSAIIAARGKSSAASAAQAAIDAMRALVTPTPAGQWFSSGVCSDGNPYGIADGLIFSFPCKSNGNDDYEIVPNLKLNDFLQDKIRETERELLEERALIL